MRARIPTLALYIVLLASPAIAGEPEVPITEKPITATDVAATPATDLNLRRDEIPPMLLAAQEAPYTLAGMRRCANIAATIGELDAILGDDIDLVADSGRKGPSAGKLAQWAVGSFIPFRGAIRELSGANEQQRRVRVAIEAGIARRAFLKGVGQERGCRYPARPATSLVLAERARMQEAPVAEAGDPPKRTNKR